MSIIDSVKDKLGGQNSGLVSHATDLVNNPATGGLEGLVQQFHANGLGGVVNSWVGQGENQAISADQITRVLGADRINAIAAKFGMSPEDASAKLAQVLPVVVSKLTPHGIPGQAA
jgi:uncharacterized protein YidB (DUF937 family)